MYMNALKIIPTPEPDRIFRDWRGISTLMGLTQYEQNSMSNVNPMGDLIKMLEKKPHNLTLALFRNMLGAIDRWDALDDTHQMFVDDAIAYLTGKRTKWIYDDQWLTVDDALMNELQQYDFFMLFADNDREFAIKIIKNLKEFGFKMCIPEDFLAGVNFVHDAIRQLLTKRCSRLIVIISPHFVNSPLNQFVSNVAQSLGISQRIRKVIPILYKDCELPEIFQHINLLDYQRSLAYNIFWVKLRISLQSTPDELKAGQSANSITEMDVAQTTATLESPAVPLHPQNPQNIPRKRNDNKFQALKSLLTAHTSLPIKPKSMVVLTNFGSTETNNDNSNCKEQCTKKIKWYSKLSHMLEISERQISTKKRMALERNLFCVE